MAVFCMVKRDELVIILLPQTNTILSFWLDGLLFFEIVSVVVWQKGIKKDAKERKDHMARSRL